MKGSAVDVLLHPVRLRIVRALAAAREATVAELATLLPDVPPASLYRHVNRLAAAGLIATASERAVRGTTERRYRLGRSTPNGVELGAATPEEHLRYFITFVATLIDDFAAYLERGAPDYARDGVGYRQIPLQLDDSEFERLFAGLGGFLQSFADLPPSAERKPRYLATIVMPAEPRRLAAHGEESHET
jgi:DNA-binding transcriptional ArsR family regulator